MTERWRLASLCAAAGLLAFAPACGEEPLPPPPLNPPGTEGTDSGPPVITTMTLDGGTSDDGIPPHCMAEGGEATGAADEGSGDGDAFKFDVGAPSSGTDFPVSCAEVQRTRSNLGCEFWAVDLPNDYRGTPISPPAAEQQFAVVVANASSLQPADVRVYVGDEMIEVAQVDVLPGETAQLSLDPLDIEPRFGTADGQAYRIESSVPITAYQFNPLDNQVEVYSNDASLLLPAHALGSEYTAVTADAILLGTSVDDPEPVNAGAFVSAVAISDGTLIEIMSSATLVDSPQSAMLNRGEVLTVISDATGVAAGNLSGTRVTASAPVAVFAGNVATAIPADGSCCADHIEHQLPPHEAWGTAYALAPPPSPVSNIDDPAVYRFTAAFDDTELRYCPTMPAGAPELLEAGQTVVFTTDEAFSVESDPDRPFAVTQFLQSFQALSAEQPGDPAMIVSPSVGQFQRRTLLAVPAGYDQDFAIIVTRGHGDVMLDGTELLQEDFEDVGIARGQPHSFIQVPLTPGAHTIESEVPFGVTVVGFADAVSYGYPGAAGLRVIAIPPAG